MAAKYEENSKPQIHEQKTVRELMAELNRVKAELNRVKAKAPEASVTPEDLEYVRRSIAAGPEPVQPKSKTIFIALTVDIDVDPKDVTHGLSQQHFGASAQAFDSFADLRQAWDAGALDL